MAIARQFSMVTVTGPKVEPVTIDQVKLHTHVNNDDEDSLIQSWISSARRAAENFQNRAYITQTLEIRFDSWPCFPMLIPRAPIQSVSSIKYVDTDGTEHTLDTADYIVDISSIPGRIGLAYAVTLPTTILQPIDAVRVQYVAGYGDKAESVPEYIKDAIMLYCSWRYENRTAEAGLMPEAFYDILRPENVYE